MDRLFFIFETPLEELSHVDPRFLYKCEILIGNFLLGIILSFYHIAVKVFQENGEEQVKKDDRAHDVKREKVQVSAKISHRPLVRIRWLTSRLGSAERTPW